MHRKSPVSSRSSQKEASPQARAVIALGEKLVAELELRQSTDTLGRWMAHYVAELIHAAKTAPQATRTDAEARCASAILELWDHRAALPNGTRPFEGLEPLMETLKGLDPDARAPFYRPTIRQKAQEDGEKGELSRRWLSLAQEVDDTARMLVDQAITRATAAAADDAMEWVMLANGASTAPAFDIELISHLLERTESSRSEERQRERLRSRLERLEAFLQAAGLLRADFQSELAELEGKLAAKSGAPEAPED